MAAYYNEIDPYAAQWLRNLIEEGWIASGEVDTRSIVDVRPSDLHGFTQCHFFAGLGGWAGALLLAGFPDDRPVWTGSCPCQPFSLAGKQKGFADDRHLWPVWCDLIRQCRPPKVYGEQVASASDWLRLVRGDLEALGYAVGAIPCEAASAGADHLRDRYWFVGDYPGERWREGRTEHAVRSGRPAAVGDGDGEHAALERRNGREGAAGTNGWPRAQDASDVGLADAHDARSQGRRLLPECADQRPAGPDGVADSYQFGEGEGRQQRSGQLGWLSRDQETCPLGNGASIAEREPHDESNTLADGGQARSISGGASDSIEWVIGADGKARRVKSGVRLLAHGVPARVAKLRALGNAIDLRPAATFIRATM